MSQLELPVDQVFGSFFVLLLFSLLAAQLFREDNKTSITLRPCPNPDCIRCRKYKFAQQNAVIRLPHLIQEWKLRHEGEEMEDIRRIQDGVSAGPPPLPTERRFPFRWKIQREIKNYGNAQDQFPSVLFLPRLQVHPIATHLHGKVCDLLSTTDSTTKKSRHKLMIDEYVNAQMYDGAWNINDAGALDPNNPNQLWEVMYLMNQGKWIEQNIQLCKGTFSLLQQIPREMLMDGCMFGNIFFSVLYPGTKIEEHCGPTNVRHRLHFPLLVPSHETHSQPSLIVSGEVIQWTEGHVFVFDDSLLHYAKYPDNDESEVRVVLVLDLWHPDLSHDERRFVTDLYPSSSSGE